MGDARADCLAIVETYKSAWEAKDSRAMAAMFHSDGVFHEPSCPPLEGREAIAGHYDGWFEELFDLDVEFTRIMVEPPHVGAEWLSRLTTDGERREILGISLFEVHDGLVRHQRDYYYPEPLSRVPLAEA